VSEQLPWDFFSFWPEAKEKRLKKQNNNCVFFHRKINFQKYDENA